MKVREVVRTLENAGWRLIAPPATTACFGAPTGALRSYPEGLEATFDPALTRRFCGRLVLTTMREDKT